jgi:hypothetical protein
MEHGDNVNNCELENNCKLANLWVWDTKKFMFETLSTSIILYGCEV